MFLTKELCGLAGISPNTRERSNWVNNALFSNDDKHTTASISYNTAVAAESSNVDNIVAAYGHQEQMLLCEGHEEPSEDTEQSLKLIRNVLRALHKFCIAVAEAQRSGMCCDHFTILRVTGSLSSHRHHDESSREAVELCRISLGAIVDLYKDLEQLSNDLSSQHRVAMPLNQLAIRVSMRARDLCQCVPPDYQLRTLPNSEFGFVLHLASLAVQALNLGFLSYV